jgi:hypothetical protein
MEVVLIDTRGNRAMLVEARGVFTFLMIMRFDVTIVTALVLIGTIAAHVDHVEVLE